MNRFSSWSLLATVFSLVIAACGSPAPKHSADGGGADGAQDAGCIGDLGCSCSSTSPCHAGLVCDSTQSMCRKAQTCAEAGCQAHQTCTGSQGSGYACTSGSCEPGFSWDASSSSCKPVAGASCQAGSAGSIVVDCSALHRSCVTDAGLAQCGSCSPGYVANGSSCVPATSCAEAGCDAVHRSCTNVPSGVTCGACTSGYAEVSGTCVSAAACSDCQAQHRTCSGTGGSVCGGCANGYVLDGSGACVAATSCASLSCTGPNASCSSSPSPHCTCSSGYAWDDTMSGCRAILTCTNAPCSTPVCVEGANGADRTCLSACPTGQGWDPIQQTCHMCNGGFSPVCGAGNPGETGLVLSRGADGAQCDCQTNVGYYVGNSSNTARDCDSDDDGWVTDAAYGALHSANDIVRTNARCAVRRVTSFTLRNDIERGQPSESRAVAVGGVTGVELFESERNDGAPGTSPPVYGTAPTDAAFLPSQLNSLTKACVAASGDFNHNNVSDVAESQQSAPSVGAGLATLYTVYTQFGYFLELHEGWFVSAQADDPGTPQDESLVGTYVIAERPRSAGNFRGVPVTWPVPAQMYWRSCERWTDTLYSTGGENGNVDTRVGGDFTTPAINTPAWRGMDHHSQFKCVLVTTQASYTSNREDSPNVVYAHTSGTGLYRRWKISGQEEALTWRPVACSYDGSSTYDVVTGMVGSTTAGDAASPLLTCSAPTFTNASELDGRVLWAVTGYDGYLASQGPPPLAGTYQHGCINECGELTETACPGYSVEHAAGFDCDLGAVSDFGQIRCGCLPNYAGGAECDVSCANDQLHLPPGGIDVFTRAGPWMCADVALSMPASESWSSSGTNTTFFGEVPSTIFDGASLTAGSGATQVSLVAE